MAKARKPKKSGHPIRKKKKAILPVLETTAAPLPPAPAPAPGHPALAFGGGFLGLVLLGIGLTTITQNQYYLPADFNFPFHATFFFLFLGILVLAATFRLLPPPPKAKADLSPWVAGSFLLAILAVGFYFRLTRIGDPLCIYWDEQATSVVDSRNLLELKNYAMIFPYGNQMPLFDYWMAFVWSHFPDATGLFMQRFASSLMDMFTVVILYFVGKELGGRRMGLLAAGLAAIDNLQVTESMKGMLETTTPFSTALVALLSLWVMRKSDWTRFILWGLGLAMAFYCYTATRPFIPFFVLLVFIWIWVKHREEWERGREAYFLSFGTLFGWLYLYLWRNQFIGDKGFLFSILAQPWFQYLFLAALGWAYYQLWQGAQKSGKGWLILRWSAALALAWFLVTPLVYLPNFASRFKEISVLQGQSSGFAAMAAQIGNNFLAAVKALFLGQGGENFSDLDIHSAVIFLFGLIFVLVRPTVKGWGMLAAIFLGMSAMFMSIGSHPARSLATVVPFIVMAAYAMDAFWASLESSGPGRAWPRLWLVLLLGFGVWAGKSTYHKIFDLWLGHDSLETLFSKAVRAQAPARLVYLAGSPYFVSTGTQGVLDEGHPLYLLQPVNPICVLPGENLKDVVVLMAGGDADHHKFFQNQYPGAQWTEIRYQDQPPNTAPALLQALIPADQLKDGAGYPFQVTRDPETGWRRECYYGLYGLAHGMIELTDCAPTPYLPPLRGGQGSESLEGIFEATAAGKYRFSATAGNFVVLYIDGKKVLDIRPTGANESASGSLKLEPGAHSVRYLVYFRNEPVPPTIYVTGPDHQKQTLGTAPAS